MRFLAAAAAVLALAACKRELTYERVELPGFSIDLPKSPDMTGLGNAAARTQYAAGSLKRGQSSKPVHIVELSWQPGILSTDEELVDLIKIMGSAMAGHPATPQVTGSPRRGTMGGQPSVSVDFRIDALKLQLIETTCGARAIQIAIGAEDPEPIVARVTRSFACHPDAAREAELASDRAPVGFDGISDWHRVDTDDAGFGISNGKTLAFFAPLPETQAIDRLGFAKILSAMIEVSLGKWTATDTEHVTRNQNVRDVAFGRVLSEGEELDLAATVWKCPVGPAVFGFAMNIGETEPAAIRAAAIDILTRARCLRPGEPAPKFEGAPPDEDEAPDDE